MVDDFTPFREIVCQTLEERDDFFIVGQASDGLDAVRQAGELEPDVILLNVGLPRLNGIDAARQIRKASPHSKIIFLSQAASIAVIEEAFRLGAHGYLLKVDAADELLPAVDAVLQGNQFLSKHVSDRDA